MTKRFNEELLPTILAYFASKGLISIERLKKEEAEYCNWWEIANCLANNRMGVIISYSNSLQYLSGHDCDDLASEVTIKIAKSFDHLMKRLIENKEKNNAEKKDILCEYVNKITVNCLKDIRKKVTHETKWNPDAPDEQRPKRTPNFDNTCSLDEPYTDSGESNADNGFFLGGAYSTPRAEERYILMETIMNALKKLDTPLELYSLLSKVVQETPQELCELENVYGRKKVFNFIIREISIDLGSRELYDTYYNAYADKDFEYSGTMDTKSLISHSRHNAKMKISGSR